MINITYNNKLNEKEDVRILKSIKEFPIYSFIPDNPEEDDIKIRLMLQYLNYAYQETKKELSGYFTERECWGLISIYTSSQIEPDLESINSSKDLLQSHISSAIYWGELCFFEDVQESLVAKIDKLTQFQAFTVFRMIVEYWEENKKNIERMLMPRGGNGCQGILMDIFFVK